MIKILIVGLIFVMCAVIIYLGNALINEQIKSKRYLNNFMELFRETYEKELNDERSK